MKICGHLVFFSGGGLNQNTAVAEECRQRYISMGYVYLYILGLFVHNFEYVYEKYIFMNQVYIDFLAEFLFVYTIFAACVLEILYFICNIFNIFPHGINGIILHTRRNFMVIHNSVHIAKSHEYNNAGKIPCSSNYFFPFYGS